LKKHKVYRNFLNIGFIGLLVLVVFVSGCTSSSTNYSNYTNQYMSFQYPAGWTVENNNVGGVNIFNGTYATYDQWIVVVPYGNYGGNISTMDDFNAAIVQASSGTESITIQNQTINGIQCTTIDSPNGDEADKMYSWKYCFFIKNGEGVEVAGLVKDISTLEHVVSTFT
jgi:hypothetical protein